MSHREDLDNIGKKILNSTRTQLYLSMHFMGPALGALDYIMDLSTTSVGTDAVFIRFNPHYLMDNFLVRPWFLNRVYMHMLIHCIFRHMFGARRHEDTQLWDLACDIAAESVVDAMDYPAIHETMTDKRAAIYADLQEKVKVLTAERLYRYFVDHPLDYQAQLSLAAEFVMDDHSFWLRMEDDNRQAAEGQNDLASQMPLPAAGAARPDARPDSKDAHKTDETAGSDHPLPAAGAIQSVDRPDSRNAHETDGKDHHLPESGANQPDHKPLPQSDTANQQPLSEKPQLPRRLVSTGAMRQKEKEWEKNAEKIRVELETTGREAGTQKGSLSWLLSFEVRRHIRYKEYLRRFRVLREESGVDLDSFDYGFYNYGLSLYGNVPLIEENEFRETRKIQQLAIAIDTSASCKDTLVQQFLNETATLLLQGSQFFTKSEIHIIECDDQIQDDIVINNPSQMQNYAKGFSLKGGYGTDFRPVFQYIDQLQQQGHLQHLKGLLYFTDGYGTYPTRPTTYDTAFVFWKDEDLDDTHVPDWAMKLYL